MKWHKLAMAAFGAMITFAAASTQAQATAVTSEQTTFNTGHNTIDATRNGTASTSFTTNANATDVIDGSFQVDLRNIEYWWRTRGGQSATEARAEQASSWTFTLEHAGVTADLGGLPADAPNDAWLMTDAFDGVVAGGEWILSATSDYYAGVKRMIAFDLNGIFSTVTAPVNGGGTGGTGGTGGAGGAGGEVPVPATALLILAGLAGMGGAARRNRRV